MKLLYVLFFFLLLIPHKVYTIDPANAQKPSHSQNLATDAVLPFIPTPSNHPTADIYALVPALRLIAACESTGDKNGTPRQFNADGSVLWGREKNASDMIVTVQRDVGELQINTWAHRGEIVSSGLNVIGSEDDNVYFGWILYEKYGFSPWSASKGCWGN